jgi:hypothetical protein
VFWGGKMSSYLKLWGTWLGAFLLGVPFLLWFVNFRGQHAFYLNDNGYVSLVASGVDVFAVLFCFAWGSLIGHHIHSWILNRRTK